MHRPARLFLALLASASASASTWGRAQAAPAAAHLAFGVYAAGLSVLAVDSKADFGPDDYRIDISYRSTGLFGTFIPLDMVSFVQGRFVGDRVAPLRFASWGTLRGNERRTTVDYPEGQPVIRTLVPAEDPNRDPVPPDMERDTMDTLSAMAFLVRHVARTGNCDGAVRIFDGRRVMETESHTMGMERLPPDYRSRFSGPALRCDMRSRQLAGFQHDVSEAELHREHFSRAYLAPLVQGQPALPVRVSFETRFFGAATAYLSEVDAVPSIR